jgi:S1-C subfamily serine protease
VILSANGLAVRDTKELITAVNCYPCGETVALCVWRDGAELVVQIVLDEG